jgi:protein-L-isoaspartate(D-aspartate) O-methyltransferase
MPDAPTLDFARMRRMMVDGQIRTFDITDIALLERMNHVPRERFLPAEQATLAYSDARLVLKAGAARRSMLTPMGLARMIQALRLLPGDRVLDVACANGYTAAVMAGLAGSVVALESEPAFSDAARAIFAEAGVANVTVATGPLADGWPAGAPFDAIFVNGAVMTGLEPLLAQLREPGRLVCVETQGVRGSGRAMIYEKRGGEIGRRELFSCEAECLPGFVKPAHFAF